MLTPEKIVEEHKRELDRVLISFIGLNSNDWLCVNVSNHPDIKTNYILNSTRTFSNLEPDKLIHNWDGTIYHLTRREIILVKFLNEFDYHLVEHDMLPIDEEYPFLLLTKEELDGFKAPKTKK